VPGELGEQIQEKAQRKSAGNSREKESVGGFPRYWEGRGRKNAYGTCIKEKQARERS